LYGFLNHPFLNRTCQTGSTGSPCPELNVKVRTGENDLSSILRTIYAKPYLKVREYRESEKSDALHPPQQVEGSSCEGLIKKVNVKMQGYVLPTDPSDVAVLTGELFLVVVGAVIVILSVLIWRNYPVLTKEGFLEIIFGFIAFTLHFLFDALDTIATASENFYETQGLLDVAASFGVIYGTFDFLDGLFTIIGLLLIAIGILRIAAYGKQLWGE